MQADLCVSFLGWRLYDSRLLSLLGCGTAYIVDFNFPEDARWNAEREAVEFGVEIRRVSRHGHRRRPYRGPQVCSCSGSRHDPDGLTGSNAASPLNCC